MKKKPKKKARIGIDEYGRTDMHWACNEGDIGRLQELIASGLKIDPIDDDGWTPLHFACQNYNLEAVKLLIQNGSKIDIQDSYGNTPLWRAVFNCRDQEGELIEYLLSQGANPQLENHSGISPFDLANRIGNYNISQHIKGR